MSGETEIFSQYVSISCEISGSNPSYEKAENEFTSALGDSVVLAFNLTLSTLIEAF